MKKFLDSHQSTQISLPFSATPCVVLLCVFLFCIIAFAEENKHTQHTSPIANTSNPAQGNASDHNMPNFSESSTSTPENTHADHLTPENSANNSTKPAPTIADNKNTEFIERLGEFVPSGIVLYDENGTPIDPLSLMDIPTIIVPVFFSCPAGCNVLQSSVAATLPNVNLVPGKDFRVITVSFDETDTPEMAKHKKNNYLAAMNFEFPEQAWVYLTGDMENIKLFMDSIGFPYTRLGPGRFTHPLGVVALAPDGKITRYLYGQSFMPVDFTMAITEAAKGQTGLSIKRIVSYCFTYDPASRQYVFSFMRVAGAVVIFGVLTLLFILIFGGKKDKKKNGRNT